MKFLNIPEYHDMRATLEFFGASATGDTVTIFGRNEVNGVHRIHVPVEALKKVYSGEDVAPPDGTQLSDEQKQAVVEGDETIEVPPPENVEPEGEGAAPAEGRLAAELDSAGK